MRRTPGLFVLIAACASPEAAVTTPATPPPVQKATPASEDVPDETPAPATTGATGSTGSTGATSATGETNALPSAATYTHTCDGSAGVALDADHFLDFDDEDQRAIVYTRGAGGAPVSETAIDLQTTEEADIEDAARVGSRIFVISSHARTSDGKLNRARHHFFALDVTGNAVALAGRTSALLDQMLDKDNWQTKDQALLAILNDASQLGDSTKASLAPEKDGINIEGLAHWPTADAPQRLAIGLRNPRWNDGAIIVTLLNPNEVIGGAAARFGEGFSVALGARGIRSFSWSDRRAALLVLAGPSKGGAGPFSLYEWRGATATKLADLPATTGSPEALIPLGEALQVLVDQGGKDVNGEECTKADVADRSFVDLIIPL